MPQRRRLTIQEILNDSQMTSTSLRNSVKSKSLTLLELCEIINELQHTSPRNSTQILTRRLYLHPLNNTKQNTSKIPTNNLLQFDESNQTTISTPRNPPYRGLSILSSSLPLIARTNIKTNHMFNSDHDLHRESNDNTTINRNNPVNLPVISRNIGSLSSSSRRTTSTTRSSFITIQRKSKYLPPPPPRVPPVQEKIDVWHHLAQTLQRPSPRDPPTTPLDNHSEFHSRDILPIPNCIRIPTCDSPIEEND